MKLPQLIFKNAAPFYQFPPPEGEWVEQNVGKDYAVRFEAVQVFEEKRFYSGIMPGECELSYDKQRVAASLMSCAYDEYPGNLFKITFSVEKVLADEFCIEHYVLRGKLYVIELDGGDKRES